MSTVTGGSRLCDMGLSRPVRSVPLERRPSESQSPGWLCVCPRAYKQLSSCPAPMAACKAVIPSAALSGAAKKMEGHRVHGAWPCAVWVHLARLTPLCTFERRGGQMRWARSSGEGGSGGKSMPLLSSCPWGREHRLPSPFPSPPQPTPELPQDPLTCNLHGVLEGKEARLLLMNQALCLGVAGLRLVLTPTLPSQTWPYWGGTGGHCGLGALLISVRRADPGLLLYQAVQWGSSALEVGSGSQAPPGRPSAAAPSLPLAEETPQGHSCLCHNSSDEQCLRVLLGPQTMSFSGSASQCSES